MKVLAIRGRNLASLEGEFEIDFTIEPLLSSGIFAISGPTGAGKSTILDAMCLALFARTPRTEQAKENNVRVRDINDDALMQGDPRFLLRRGTATGYAETDFLALNGHRYRTRWSISRAREKENGRLQNPRTTLFNIDTGEEEQGSRGEIQSRIMELIGLTFDQFTRSVLLAQNDFSTFLKAEQGEKASLLEKLTGTEQYSVISRKIFEKNAEAKDVYEKIRMQIEGTELLSEEEQKSIRSILEGIDKKLENLEKLKKEEQALQEQVKNTELLIRNKQIQQEEASKNLIEASESVTRSKKEYDEAKTEQEQVEKQFKILQPELLTARKLDIRIESEKQSLSETEIARNKAQKELSEAESKLKKLTEQQQKGQQEVQKLKAWYEKYKAKEKTADQLSALLLHLDTAYTARQAKEKAQTTLETLRQQIKLLDEKIKTIRSLVKLTNTDDTIQAINSCRSKRESLLLEQARFVTEGNVKALREKLSEGTPCPVCGSTEHPYTAPHIHERQEIIKQEIAALTLRLQHLESLSSLLAECKQPTEQLPREENENSSQSEVLTKSLQAADNLFGNNTWQVNWLQNPETFRLSLITFANDWKNNKDKLQEQEHLQSVWKSEQQTVEHFLAPLKEQAEITQKVYHNRQESLQKLQAERSILLDGKAADITEKEYTLKLEQLKIRLEKLQKIQTEQAGIAEQLKGVTEQINKDVVKASEELSAQQKTLEEWIRGYQISEETEPLDKVLSDTRQQQTEYAFRIRKHEENKIKMDSLQKELDEKRTISERWGKLNELAGSADGAKFRRIAQGYTLDLLLNYANVQLRNLTNRYYLERVPETLALQVIDRDMCDEVRTVHSLSGGESFLVSLALALGLSSLSSNRMKVESLFIDEGFGSLDTDTLRIALDALESLRTQGRKIGVISHVQEMTERIPVQIKVSRAGNGRSYLEVC